MSGTIAERTAPIFLSTSADAPTGLAGDGAAVGVVAATGELSGPDAPAGISSTFGHALAVSLAGLGTPAGVATGEGATVPALDAPTVPPAGAAEAGVAGGREETVQAAAPAARDEAPSSTVPSFVVFTAARNGGYVADSDTPVPVEGGTPADPEHRTPRRAAVADRPPAHARKAAGGSTASTIIELEAGARGVTPAVAEHQDVPAVPIARGEAPPAPEGRSGTPLAAFPASSGPAPVQQPPVSLSLPSADGPAPDAELRPTFDAPDWGEALGERVLWMSGRGTHQALLRLNPPHLGVLEVRVQVADGQATVSFHAQHPDVRDAIQAAIPRLREMMAEAGLQLADAHVSHGGPGGRGGDRDSAGAWAAASVSVDAAPDQGVTPVGAASARAGRGLLDLYA